MNGQHDSLREYTEDLQGGNVPDKAAVLTDSDTMHKIIAV